MPALGRDTQLAIAAGIDALRDAGIPLVQHYKTTTTGTQLPDRWSLPDELRDDTGVIFASAFPGLEEMTDEVARQTTDRMRRERLDALESLRARMVDHDGTDAVVLAEVDRRIHDLSRQLEEEPYDFDRRFIFRVLSMGHSQFAELIGARGPNTQINSACASTTQAVALAEDWIRVGRCRRVIVVAADDATSDVLLGWLGAGFLASGAAATDAVVEDAALPVRRAPPRDDHRHGRRVHRRGERGGGARAWPDADLRGARLGHRELRLPRHAPGRQPHRRRHGADRRAGRGTRRAAPSTWPARCCSSRTRPTRPRAAAAQRRRSTRCARSSARTPTAS